MEYRAYPVPPPLDAYVECVWFLTNVAHGAGQPEQRVLPDGCIELIVHFGERFASVSSAGIRTTQPSSVVVGILTRPLVLEPPAVVETMGVRFRPGGAYPFFRISLAEITDQAVRLDDLWGAVARRWRDRLSNAADAPARVAVVAAELGRMIADVALDPSVAVAVHALTRSAGRAAIAATARHAGRTPRHLQRRFAERVGVGPKLLARILRFQNTLRQRTPHTPIDWARVAVDCGFSDQSHLIHDYAAFAGETPRSLADAEGEMSAYFTAPQRLAVLLDGRR